MANVNPISAAPAQLPALDDKSKAKLQKAVRDFESIMMGYMLKSMRSSMSSEGMFGESFGGEMLDGMFDNELAGQMSRNSSLGIADMMYRKMTGEHLPALQTLRGQHEETRVPQAQKARTTTSGNDVPPSNAKKGSHEMAVLPTIRKGAGAKVPEERPVSPRHVETSIDKRLERYDQLIREASDLHGVSPHLLKAVIATESGGNANAQSPKNAKGLMQLIDSTAADMGVQNVWDPRENILAGAKYLQQLLGRFAGNIEHTIASYNAGPGAVEKHGGVPPFPETKEFVKKVMNYVRYFQQQDGAGHGQE